MTRTEFLTELASIRDEFEWTLKPHAQGPRVRLHIRAVPKTAPQVVLDPLGALCYVHHRTALAPNDWARAGEMLGLAAAGEVAAAASDRTWAGIGPRREPIEYLQKLRARLESAVGLVKSADI